MQVQVDHETVGRKTAFFAVCVHAFVTVKPGGLNSNYLGKHSENEIDCSCIISKRNVQSDKQQEKQQQVEEKEIRPNNRTGTGERICAEDITWMMIR